MNDDAPVQSKKPLWFRSGSKKDPNHPFADVLQQLTNLSAALTRLFKTEQGKILLQALTDVANLQPKVRFVAYTSEVFADGELFGGTAKFVGFRALRDLIKKAGLSSRPLSPTWVRKTFLDVLNETEEQMLEAEGGEE